MRVCGYYITSGTDAPALHSRNLLPIKAKVKGPHPNRKGESMAAGRPVGDALARLFQEQQQHLLLRSESQTVIGVPPLHFGEFW